MILGLLIVFFFVFKSQVEKEDKVSSVVHDKFGWTKSESQWCNSSWAVNLEKKRTILGGISVAWKEMFLVTC